jgi:hypothetical protein
LLLTLLLAWLQQSGLLGEGASDYCSWVQKKVIQVSAASKHFITYRDFEHIVQELNLAPRIGDILMVRTGSVG